MSSLAVLSVVRNVKKFLRNLSIVEKVIPSFVYMHALVIRELVEFPLIVSFTLILPSNANISAVQVKTVYYKASS